MSILERIQMLRDEKGGISINRLEKEAGVTRGSMAKWDSSTPSYNNAKKVADYFGVSVDYILTGNQKKLIPEDEPMSLDALRALSKEELYELMNNVVKALKEKE